MAVAVVMVVVVVVAGALAGIILCGNAHSFFQAQ